MSTIDKISVDGTVYDVAPGAGTVGTDALADGSVTTAKLGEDYLATFTKVYSILETEATTKASATEYGRVKIGDGIDVTNGVISVSGTEVADGSVTTAKLADAAVTGDKIADATVTGDKIADATVTGDKIADATVSMAKLDADFTAGLNVIATKVNTYASTTAYGRVKIGDGIDVTNGVISVTSGGSTYTLPAATADTLGGIKVGDGLTVAEDGTLSATGGGSSGGELADGSVTTAKLADKSVTSAKLANNAVTGDKIASQTVTRANLKFYCVGKNQLDTLTVDSARLCSSAVTTEKIADGAVTGAKLGIASADTIGGVKVGDGLSIATDGTLSATGGGSGGSYTLPVATADTLGGVKVGTGLAVESDGTVYTTGEAVAVVAPATTETLGGIKVGDNLTITSDGTLSASGGELADGSVTTAKLADSAVTSAKLANFCINRDSLFNQGVITYSSLHDTVWAAIYPVGSVYCTTNASFDPNSYSFSWSSGGTTLKLGRKQKTSGTWELLDNDGTVYRWKRVK